MEAMKLKYCVSEGLSVENSGTRISMGITCKVSEALIIGRPSNLVSDLVSA